METPLISKRQFNKIRRILPSRKHKKRLDDRLVISAILLVVKHGLPWRYIPEFYGNWKSIYSKFRRWSKAGIIQQIFESFAGKLPKRCVAMIDSTFAKASRTASSMKADDEPRELGRSRGGITTKIHLLCNEQGLPMDFLLSAGNVSDVKIAPTLVARNKMKTLLADKAYDSNSFRKQLKEQHIAACIPAKSNRKVPIEHDKELYKKRHTIENMFGRIKDMLGIAFRTNRCAHTFHSFVSLALITLFLNADRA